MIVQDFSPVLSGDQELSQTDPVSMGFKLAGIKGRLDGPTLVKYTQIQNQIYYSVKFVSIFQKLKSNMRIFRGNLNSPSLTWPVEGSDVLNHCVWKSSKRMWIAKSELGILSF